MMADALNKLPPGSVGRRRIREQVHAIAPRRGEHCIVRARRQEADQLGRRLEY
jgi:hypothetical protein